MPIWRAPIGTRCACLIRNPGLPARRSARLRQAECDRIRHAAAPVRDKQTYLSTRPATRATNSCPPGRAARHARQPGAARRAQRGSGSDTMRCRHRAGPRQQGPARRRKWQTGDYKSHCDFEAAGRLRGSVFGPPVFGARAMARRSPSTAGSDLTRDRNGNRRRRQPTMHANGFQGAAVPVRPARRSICRTAASANLASQPCTATHSGAQPCTCRTAKTWASHLR